MKVQTWAYLAAKDHIRSDFVTACAQRIYGMEEFHKIPSMHDTAVWAEIAGPVLHHASCKEHTGKLFGSDAYPRICLGVLEKYIVSRFELLDEVVLQQQCICLGLHDGILGIGNLRHHHGSLARKSVRRHEILRDPFVQVLCLAYIYDIPLGVIITVDSGGMRK